MITLQKDITIPIWLYKQYLGCLIHLAKRRCVSPLPSPHPPPPTHTYPPLF